MDDLIRRCDWDATPLGPPDRWPSALKVAVRIMLTSRFAMWLGWGPELTFLYNDAYARMTLGRKHPWALGRPAREVWAEIWADIGPRIDNVLTTGSATWDEGLRLMLERSGFREETYHTFSYSPLVDDGGAVAGMLCVVSEETERVIGERRLAALSRLTAGPSVITDEAEALAALAARLAERREDLPFAAIYERHGEGPVRLRAGIGIAADDAADRWLRASEAVERMEGGVVLAGGLRPCLPTGPWGEPPEEAVVLPLLPVSGDRVGVIALGINPYRPRDAAYDGFLDLVGRQVGASLAAARAYEDERRRAAALAELDRAKTEFFSNVSHEFRTPLTLILGPIEEALARQDGAVERETLVAVHRNALRLLRLVNSLLDFSRIEAHRLAADRRPLELDRLTADLAGMFRSVVESAGLAFEVRTEPVRAAVDPEMWERIVLNLLSNAFKHTFHGAIRVTLRQDDDEALLEVADTGTGIPDDQIEHLFERFHRVPGARARSHEGTGIGLAMVRSLVGLHGGTVHAHSHLGAGSTFAVRVPLLPGVADRAAGAEGIAAAGAAEGRDDPPASRFAQAWVEEALRWNDPGAQHRAPGVGTPPLPAATAGAQETRPARLLLVDDNADMRAYLAHVLSPLFEIEVVADGRQALDAAIRRPPELVISDMMMPELDGTGLVRALRENPRTRHVPIILLSARAGGDAQVAGLEAGADDYLVKPFSASELVARARTHVRLSRERRQAVQLRDAFVGLVSHELRTPVTTIYGAARLLERGSLGPAETSELVGDIAAESDRLRTLVEDLLALARLEGGELSLGIEPVLLGHLARRVAAASGAPWSGRPVRVEGHETLARGDAVYIEQVLRNLLSNAAKYSPGSTGITLEVRTEGDRATLRVLDEGPGITLGDQDRLFQMYYRAVDVATRVSGAGIGLYVCRQIVEATGGGVWVAPRPTKGSEFGFWLPSWHDEPA